jgi:hypothetical protein
MGNFRLDISKKFSGAALFVFGFFALMFYLMYWSMLGALWLIYGVLWITFVLPFRIIKRIISLIKSKQTKQVLQREAK